MHPPAVLAADHPAQEVVESAVTEALEVLRRDGDELFANPARLRAEIDRIVVPNAAFEATTRLAVGKAWRKADTNQRRALVGQFETLLPSTYTDALRQYSGQAIVFGPFRPGEREDRATVRSTFEAGGGAADVAVDYKLRDTDGRWRIHDVVVDGLSLVTHYRNAFVAEVARGGVSGLVAAITSKNAAVED